MIPIKNEREIAVMRRACKITAAARALAGEMVRPGVTTKAIDKAVHDFIVSQGATPSFLHYSGYPASVCISVNNTVIHGIPDGRVLQEGDIVSVDVGAKWQGFHGDCAATYACGKISPEAQRLIDVTKQSFFEGVKFSARDAGSRISGMPCRPMPNRSAAESSATSSATVSVSICTRSLRSRTMASPAEAPD